MPGIRSRSGHIDCSGGLVVAAWAAPCWSLIARIGNGSPFEVGTSTQVVTTAGELYLGVNDNNFSDNSGSWTVRIKLGGMQPSA